MTEYNGNWRKLKNRIKQKKRERSGDEWQKKINAEKKAEQK